MDFVTTSVTLISCTLVSGNPLRARASLLWPQPAGPPALPGLRPELLIGPMQPKFWVGHTHTAHAAAPPCLPQVGYTTVCTNKA